MTSTADLRGRQLTAHIDPAQGVWQRGDFTSAQTGTALWTPAAGKKIAITSLVLSSYGTTAFTCKIWFGGAADTTYTAGTDQLVVGVSFAPSTTSKPGLVLPLFHPIFAATADHVLRITTVGNGSIEVCVYGYEV